MNKISDELVMRAAKKAHDKYGNFNDYQDLPNDELFFGRRKRDQAWELVYCAESRIEDENGNIDLNNPYVKKIFDYYDSLDWSNNYHDLSNPHDVLDLSKYASEETGIASPICADVFYIYLEQNSWIEHNYEEEYEDEA